MNAEEITRELVKIQSTPQKTGEKNRVLNYVENLLNDQDYQFREFEDEEARSLLITFRETMSPNILLHGHLDVVSASGDLFQPEKRDGKLYGRGTADMKSGVACCIKLMQRMAEKDGTPDVGLLLTTDEEVGGFKGTGYVVDQGLEPGFVISAEPDDSGDFPSIVNKQKGVLQLKITAEGKSAHGSKPGKGVNAAEKLMEKYRELKRLFSDGEFPTTVNLGRFESGEEVNKVPENAEMHLDIRYSQQYPAEKVLEDIRSIDEIEVEVTARAPMMNTSRSEKALKSLQTAVQEATGKKAEFRSENFASDMRFFTSRNIPAVCFGPEGKNLHGEDEYVELYSLQDYIKSLEMFVEEAG